MDIERRSEAAVREQYERSARLEEELLQRQHQMELLVRSSLYEVHADAGDHLRQLAARSVDTDVGHASGGPNSAAGGVHQLLSPRASGIRRVGHEASLRGARPLTAGTGRAGASRPSTVPNGASNQGPASAMHSGSLAGPRLQSGMASSAPSDATVRPGRSSASGVDRRSSIQDKPWRHGMASTPLPQRASVGGGGVEAPLSARGARELERTSAFGAGGAGASQELQPQASTSGSFLDMRPSTASSGIRLAADTESSRRKRSERRPHSAGPRLLDRYNREIRPGTSGKGAAEAPTGPTGPQGRPIPPWGSPTGVTLGVRHSGAGTGTLQSPHGTAARPIVRQFSAGVRRSSEFPVDIGGLSMDTGPSAGGSLQGAELPSASWMQGLPEREGVVTRLHFDAEGNNGTIEQIR